MRQTGPYCLTVMGVTVDIESLSESELSVLDATSRCWEAHGLDKVTVEDICAAAGVSRATLYRMFPGGRDVLFEAVRTLSLRNFFTSLLVRVEGADDLEEVLVRCISVAHAELTSDKQLAAMLATAPGETLGDLTVHGVSRIVRVASEFIVPLLDQFLSRAESAEIVEVLCRLVISVYLAPSAQLDFSDESNVRRIVRLYLLSHTAHH